MKIGFNIVGDAANEPSIAVDATNPNRITVGWRQFDTIASNFRQAGLGWTTDGGASWQRIEVPGGSERSWRDVHAFDAETAVLVNAGQPAVLLRTEDGGATWRKVDSLPGVPEIMRTRPVSG